MDRADTDIIERYAHRVLRSGAQGMRRVTDILRRRRREIPSDPASILVVKLAGLGDMVCLTPFLAALREKSPGARITLLAGSGYESLYRTGEFFDDTIPWTPCGLRELPGAIRKFREKCGGAFDLAINTDPFSDMSALLTLSSGAKASLGFIPKGSGRRAYSVPVEYSGGHATDAFIYLGEALEMRVSSDPIPPQLTTAEISAAGKSISAWGVDEHTLLIGMSIDARENAISRSWPPEKFIMLAQSIEEIGGYKTVFLGLPEEDRFVSRHVKQMQTKPINLAGRTSARQLAAILTRLHLLITGNTGTMRLAAALGVPTLSVLRPEKARWLCLPEDERHGLIISDPDQSIELPIEKVRTEMTDMLDHFADPDEPPWLER